MPTNTAEFDVDDSAGAEFDGGLGIATVVDAFIQTERGAKLRLQACMGVDIVPRQRLLDHQ